MDFLKQLFGKLAGFWTGWSSQQKLILSAVVVVVIIGIAALFMVSSSPVMFPVIDAPIRDEAALDRIVLRLNQENVRVVVTPNGLIQVQDEATAKRMRTILITEDLVPSGIDRWNVFAKDRWTYTDFERNVNLQRSQTLMITDHIRAIDDIDNANVVIVWPERRPSMFPSEQHPVTASVSIVPKHGSDILTNKRKIEGIQRLLLFSVPGLTEDNIVITDNRGLQLNDFAGMAGDFRQSLIEREQRFRRNEERELSSRVLSSLQRTFSADRVRDLNVHIEMDLSQRTISTQEHFPFTVRTRTPGLPYDDSIIRESVTISSTHSETRWRGTGYNPEGPPGVEGQMPPAFRDMSNLYGEMTQETRTVNEVINTRNIHEVVSPQMGRRTLSVNIDGRHEWVFDEKGNPVILPNGSIERRYIPLTEREISDAGALIRDAVGFSAARGDSVTVRNIAFDRTEEWRLEDEAYFRQKQIQTTILIFITGLTLLLFGFILFRMISREIERRRRLAEVERARREQMLRESAMAEAEQDGTEVSISLEERSRMELMEGVINMAKEHPEDAAQLIRTWIAEE